MGRKITCKTIQLHDTALPRRVVRLFFAFFIELFFICASNLCVSIEREGVSSTPAQNAHTLNASTPTYLACDTEMIVLPPSSLSNYFKFGYFRRFSHINYGANWQSRQLIVDVYQKESENIEHLSVGQAINWLFCHLRASLFFWYVRISLHVFAGVMGGGWCAYITWKLPFKLHTHKHLTPRMKSNKSQRECLNQSTR